MQISYNWLKQFIDFPYTESETATLLTDLGLEVEGIKEFSPIKGGLKGVVVGYVKECFPHPNADKLKITKVAVGQDILQIVCGAPNIAKGQNVLVATVGTTLYTEKDSFTISKTKLRGEISEGMICSEKELGLGTSEDGILVVDSKIKPGTPANKVFEVESDAIFEIGLTPNRSDAMSHWGVARDLRAGLQQRGISTKVITPSTTTFQVDNRTQKIKISVHDNTKAPRYCGLTISELKVGPSPAWLQNRLKALGLAPINNVVDATNYVLHELGQPLHAFDASKVVGNEIHVKTIASGTKFTTLDGVERSLHEEDLMICDAEKPLCIAGVFGGINSGVTNETTSIFLESAYFNPISIRKTAKRHGLSTDASFRFERGVDPNITDYALRRAAILIKQLAGGIITGDLTDLYPKKIEGNQVYLPFEKANKLIGEEIPKDTIKNILTSLDIKITNMTEIGIGMTIPPYRNDVTREVDVIEEILRVYGYNNIQFSQKLNASTAKTAPVEDYQIKNKVAAQLIAHGFYEMLNNSLTTPDYAKNDSDKKEDLVNILNPLSHDLSSLRNSMLWNGLESVAYNLNRNNTNLSLFEFGKTYHKKADASYVERKHLTLYITGTLNAENWTLPTKKIDFFYGKGIVESVLKRLGFSNLEEEITENPIYSEGIKFIQNKKTLVEFGILNNKVCRTADISAEVFYADFDWDALLSLIHQKAFKLQVIPKFPGTDRDFALLIDESVSFKKLKEIALQTEKKVLKKVELFDVYTGKNLPEGKKSYALKFVFQDSEKTLTDVQVDKIMKKLRKRFEDEVGATLR